MTLHRRLLLSRRLPVNLLAACLAVAATFALASAKAREIIHTEASGHSPIVVYQQGGERCMKFGSVRALGRQTCMDLQTPDKMVFSYTRMMMSALFVKPNPRRVLIVGLGGGTLSRALGKVLPGTMIDTVEIDPAVVKVAQRFFDYRQSPTRRVFIEDGRAFIERAHRERRQYDLILLDAFDANYIPAHLQTREFLQHVRSILAPDGVLAANTFTSSTAYDQESVTYAQVFGDFFNLRDNNRVIIAVRGALPDKARLQNNANAIAGKIKPFGIEIKSQLQMFSRAPDWDEQAEVLTDSRASHPKIKPPDLIQ